MSTPMPDPVAQGRPTIAAAARVCLWTSVLFLVVYGGTNWLAARRSDVGSWCFEWERHIPFVPAMIVPYLSIDLFFLGAPFLCGSTRELRTHARRVSFAIIVAGAVFLVFPLRFAFDRPAAGGWLGSVFDWFRAMDPPFNEFPSLHICLRTILADVYARHTAGPLRTAVSGWFVLIGLSTVLTHQHHVIDIVGGFALGAVCLHLFREPALRTPVVPNPRVGAYYAATATAALATALIAWPVAGLLLWPAFAAGLAAAGYFGLGPGIHRKEAGRLPWVSRLVMAPVLFGQYVSLRHYRRQCRPWDRVTDSVWIGSKLGDAEAAEAVRQGVTSVLDMTAEFSEARPLLSVDYRNIPVLDLTAPTPDDMREAAAFIAARSATGIVFVHCKAGYSRSAAAVGAWLLASGRAATAEEAMEWLRRVRPSIVIRPEARRALSDFATARDRGRGGVAPADADESTPRTRIEG